MVWAAKELISRITARLILLPQLRDDLLDLSEIGRTPQSRKARSQAGIVFLPGHPSNIVRANSEGAEVGRLNREIPLEALEQVTSPHMSEALN